MFCTQCGTKLGDEMLFCPSCGTKVASRGQAVAPQQAVAAQQTVAVQQTAAVQPTYQVPATQPAPAPAVGAAWPPVPAVTARNVYQKVQGPTGKRSEIVFPCRMDPAQALAIAEGILVENGYEYINRKGELVWKKGTGMMTAMQYMKVVPLADALWVQGWVQVGMGDAGLSDMCLDGIAGSIPKKMVRNLIDKIGQCI